MYYFISKTQFGVLKITTESERKKMSKKIEKSLAKRLMTFSLFQDAILFSYELAQIIVERGPSLQSQSSMCARINIIPVASE